MSLAPFGFATAGALRFGRGVHAEALPFARAQARRVLVLRSPSVAAGEGLVQALRQSAEVLDLPARGEPDLPGVEAHVATARGFGPDLIIAMGGGAVIDHGKALAALIPAPHGAMRYLEVVGEGRPLDAPPLPLVAIPTTAGTGAEVTRNAVIQIPEDRRKVSLRDPRLYPALALVDPELCASRPKPVAIASGLDAITQVIEPFICARANPMTDALCRDAIPRGLRALRGVIETGAPDAWDDMALTSAFGGMALANAGLGALHGFAGVIGGRTGAAHGAICGALLLPVLQANAAAAAPDSPAHHRIAWVMEQIAREFGHVQDFGNWTRAHGLPSLRALGIPAEMHGSIARDAVQSSSYRANPVDLSENMLMQILSES